MRKVENHCPMGFSQMGSVRLWPVSKPHSTMGKAVVGSFLTRGLFGSSATKTLVLHATALLPCRPKAHTEHSRRH